jgi:hypothetical protein
LVAARRRYKNDIWIEFVMPAAVAVGNVNKLNAAGYGVLVYDAV